VGNYLGRSLQGLVKVMCVASIVSGTIVFGDEDVSVEEAIKVRCEGL